jgi:short subunit dehydrogenase-like uncharacterized protein
MIAGDFLLYGATGYTGELIARRCLSLGLRPVLSGRNAIAVGTLANELNFEHRIASVDNAKALVAALSSIPESNRVVLNCAGPFSQTAKQVADACLRNGAHYLDITGEIAMFELMARKGKEAEKLGLMLLPGTGFDVVPSDCLAAYVARRIPCATNLVIAIQGVGSISRGTAFTSIQNIGNGGAVRRNGEIVRVPSAWKSRKVVFSGKPVEVTTMPWGDVATAFYSTGIPDIEVYMMIPDAMRNVLRYGRPLLPMLARQPINGWLQSRVRSGSPGPDEQARERGKSRFWAEASDGKGNKFAARLFAPEGYELTVRTAIECVRRVLGGMSSPGFRTPSLAFGPDLVLAIDGVRREDA